MLYNILFVGLIVFFCYFYTAVTFKTDDVAEISRSMVASFLGFVRVSRPRSTSIMFSRASL